MRTTPAYLRQKRRPATDGDGILRVLHVSQPTVAGVARVVGELARDHAGRGWDVHVACPDGGDLAGWVGADVHRWSWEATRSPGVSVPRETRALAGIVRDVRPDLVHLHSAKAGLAGRLAVRGRRPTVFQPHAWSFHAVHGRVRDLTVRWERAAARWTDLFVAVSSDERRAGERAGVTGHYAVIPNGVDVDIWQPADREAARQELGLGAQPTAVCVGRLCEQKGQLDLLAAWDEVRAAVPDAVLVLVGDGPDRAAIEDAGAPLGNRLVVPGPSGRPERWLSAADVVVLASRWEAGLPLAVMEAMALERSVVATDAEGVRDGLPPACGEIVPIGDRHALADALARRLKDVAGADAEGEQGRRWVAEHFDTAVAHDRLAAAYSDLLHARRA